VERQQQLQGIERVWAARRELAPRWRLERAGRRRDNREKRRRGEDIFVWWTEKQKENKVVYDITVKKGATLKTRVWFLLLL